MENHPWVTCADFEQFCQRKAGAFHENLPWSLEDISKRRAEQMRKDHRTLQTVIVLLSHAYEVCRVKRQVFYVQAFLTQASNAALTASSTKEQWSEWPLLGIGSSDDAQIACLAKATERVALAAYEKERAI